MSSLLVHYIYYIEDMTTLACKLRPINILEFIIN
nr:MAG TPA: docking domain containing protein [Bacteriophage sp.]